MSTTNKNQTKKEIQAELEKLQAAYQQQRRDVANIRQRLGDQQATVVQQTQAQTISRLLPIFDGLERAFADPPEAISDSVWVKGVLGLQRLLADEMASIGLARIKTVGEEFDPHLMEAVATTETTSQPPETVTAELAAGYFYNGQVLRVAKVQVAKAPPN